MQKEIQSIIDYLKSAASDPVPQYILARSITEEPSGDLTPPRESKWYHQLVSEQWENGSWGRFHTQDSKATVKQKFVTTERALARSLDLSLDHNDPMIQKAIGLMERYLTGEEDWLDTNEKHDGFPIAFRTIIAANLSLFVPDHPLLQEKKKALSTLLTKSLLSGTLDEKVWNEESGKTKVLLLNPFTSYIVWLAQKNNFLDKAMEQAFFEYIWRRCEGIYYVTGMPLDTAIPVDSKYFSTWLSSLECVSNFSMFPEFMQQGHQKHLLNEIERCLHTDIILPNAAPIFHHYSESWSKGSARKNDLILRILRVLIKSDVG